MASSELLAQWVRAARDRSLSLVADLRDRELIGPRLPVTNPFLWEVGHLAWFQERWVLRHALGRDPIRPDGDELYDSSAVPHDSRWELALPTKEQTLAYCRRVQEEVEEVLATTDVSAEVLYHALYTALHEDMHSEAFLYMRQTLGHPLPAWMTRAFVTARPHPGDVEVPGGTFWLGSTPREPFCFDNEKWAHPVEVETFVISRSPVTQGEFAVFVDDGGYERPDLWSSEGWEWLLRLRENPEVEARVPGQPPPGRGPAYWRLSPDPTGGPGHLWECRVFNRWLRLDPYLPMMHVNYHEAEAWCRWAGRRLPTEVEWEKVAAWNPPEGMEAPDEGTHPAQHKRRFPWGTQPPTSEHANLDLRNSGPVGVDAFASGDSRWGCRQLLGNVWEWTSSDFQPYPGFVADPYTDYSEPWFGSRKVLRGGSWATSARMIRNTYRNFAEPHRRDGFFGFRTCPAV